MYTCLFALFPATTYIQVYQVRLGTDGNQLSLSPAACTNTAKKKVNSNSFFSHNNNNNNNNKDHYCSVDGGDEEDGTRGGGIVLDICWWWRSTVTKLAPATSAATTKPTTKMTASGGSCATSFAWRVGRSRKGEDRDFVVKEGVGVVGRDSGAAWQSSTMTAEATVAAPAKATAMSSAASSELDAGDEDTYRCINVRVCL